MDKARRICRGILVTAAIGWLLLAQTGCTRRFYRKQADREVDAILREKDIFDAWKIESMHVYPNPLARHADPTNPDRPPMPPDDPAAVFLGPNPQKPRHAGVARIEGTGYFDLLAEWDAENRAERVARNRLETLPAPTEKMKVIPESTVPGPIEALPAIKSNPYLLKIDQAMELGLVNSREYQSRREDLYLSALPVTRERFGFAAQYLAVGQMIRERTGSAFLDSGDRWRYGSTVGVTKLFSTGAVLLIGFANQTVVEIGNPTKQRVTSVSGLNLDVLQPLLRGGGKAVTLEPLTQAERNLLYEIRNYAHFRKEYFQYLTGGGAFTINPGGVANIGSLASSHPSLGSLINANPARQQVVPAGLGAVGGSAVPGQLLLGNNPIAVRTGYLPALFQAAIMRYEYANVDNLTDILKLFESYEEGGLVSALQVDQVRQQLLQGQSSVLAREQERATSLDLFKAQLGVPINVPLELDDETILPITDQIQGYTQVLDDHKTTVKDLDLIYKNQTAPKATRGVLDKLMRTSKLTSKAPRFLKRFASQWKTWQGYDDKTITQKLFEHAAVRRKILDRKTVLETKERTAAEQKALIDLLKELGNAETEIAVGQLERELRKYVKAPWEAEKEDRDKKRKHSAAWQELQRAVLAVLLDPNNERFEALRAQWREPTPAIVEGINVVDADREEAYEIVSRTALENRFDLMNARAQVVDAWRQLKVFANGLLGVFNVAYHADSFTPNDKATPLAFDASRTRHQLVMNFEIPLVRLTERNAFRAAQIAYQRGRRDLQRTEDAIVAQVRVDIRQLQVLRENLRIQQKALELAYRRAESSYESFTAPQAPQTGGAGGGGGSDGPVALTNQLLQAYGQLPQAQQNVLRTWIDYQIARQQLFVDLELMPLDARGVWIDDTANHPIDRNPGEFQRERQPPGAGENP